MIDQSATGDSRARGPLAIDMHAHLYSRVLGSVPIPPHTYLEYMDRAGIEKSVIAPVDGLFLDPGPENDRLVSWCRQGGERLIPFCTVRPRDQDATQEIRRSVLDLGCRGVKLHPVWQGISPTEQGVIRVAEEAARLGVPLLVHDGTPPFSGPLVIGWIAERFPELTVILAHGGLMDLWIDAIAAAGRHPNCYICMCGTAPPAVFARIIASVDRRQLVLGTDGGVVATGMDLIEFRMSEFRSIQLDEPTRMDVFRTNAMRILSL